MDDQPLIVLFKDNQSLWPDLSPSISRSLPLTNVLIRYPSATHPVTIPELDLLFLPSETKTFGLSCGLSLESSRRASQLQNSSVISKTSLRGTTTSGSGLLQVSKSVDSTKELSFAKLEEKGPEESISISQLETLDESGSRQATQVGSTLSSIGSQDSRAFSSGTSLSEKPYIGIYFFQVDSIEAFRAQHRKNVKLWIDQCMEQHMEWLLVLLSPISESPSQEKLAKKFGDKLRSETLGFHQDAKGKSKDRFVRLSIDSSKTGKLSKEATATYEETWSIFVSRLRECIALAVEHRYILIEDEINRQETAGHTTTTQASDRPKARYSSVFFATEELALLHSKCGRYQDANLVYQDIDLTRSPVVNPRRFRALFKTVGFSEPGDDFPTLFNCSRKPYRQLIASNKISYFDFRSYFFARQQLLLIKQGAGDECARRTLDYIRRMSQEVRELSPPTVQANQSTFLLPKCFVWSTLAALNSANYMIAQFDRIKWVPDMLSSLSIVAESPRENQLEESNYSSLGESIPDELEKKSEDDEDQNDSQSSTQHHSSILHYICLQLYMFGLQQFRYLITTREHMGWLPILDETDTSPPITRGLSLTFTTLPANEFLKLQVLTKGHLEQLLSSREVAHETERRLIHFILRQSLEFKAHRTVSMLSITAAQWTALRCHQYRHQRASIITPSERLDEVAAELLEKRDQDYIADGEKKSEESQRSQLLDDGKVIERLSSRQLRAEIDLGRNYLERCGGLTQEEEWAQLYVVVRALLCELERSAGLRGEELLSCYLLSNNQVDQLAFSTPNTFGVVKEGNPIHQIKRDALSLRRKKSFNLMKSKSIGDPLDYFSTATRIDFVAAHSMALLMTRGVLQSKLYLKRFLKLAALGIEPSKALSRTSDSHSITRINSTTIPNITEPNDSRDTTPQTSSNQTNDVTSGISKIKTTDNKNGNVIPKQVTFEPQSSTLSDGLDFSLTRDRGGKESETESQNCNINSRVQILGSPNLYVFIDIQSDHNRWRESNSILRPSNLHNPPLVTEFQASFQLPMLSSSYGDLPDGFLDPESNKPVCPLDPCLSQSFHLASVTSDALLCLIPRRAISSPPYSQRPALTELYPFNEVRACYIALGSALDQLGSGISASRTPVANTYLPSVDEERLRSGLTFTTIPSSVFTNTSIAHSGPRRRALWGLKRARLLAKGHLKTSKTTASSTTSPPATPGHIAHHWGARLGKLNTKLMGHSVKRQLTRQRSSQQTTPIASATSLEVETHQDVECSKLPLNTTSTIRQSMLLQSQLIKSNPLSNKDTHHSLTTFPSQQRHQHLKRSISLSDSSPDHYTLHNNRRPCFRELSRLLHVDSLLSQLNESEDDLAAPSYTERTSVQRFNISSPDQSTKGLFSGGIESGLSVPDEPIASLVADFGETILVRIYIFSSLCREIPITAVIIKLVACSAHIDMEEHDDTNNFVNFDLGQQNVSSEAIWQDSVYLPTDKPNADTGLHSRTSKFHFSAGSDSKLLPDVPGDPTESHLGKSVFIQFRARDISTSSVTAGQTRQTSHLKSMSDPSNEAIIVKPGLSLLTLTCPIRFIGRFAFDQVYLVCRSCILSQAVGDLPPIDKMRKIFETLHFSQITPQNRQRMFHEKDYKANVNTFNSAAENSIQSFSKNISPFNSLEHQRFTLRGCYSKIPNILYGAINFATTTFGYRLNAHLKPPLISLSQFPLPLKQRLTQESQNYNDMLQFFVRLPLMNLKLPEVGWFPITILPVELLPATQCGGTEKTISSEMQQGRRKTRNNEIAIIADSLNVLRIVIHNARGTLLKEKPRFTLFKKASELVEHENRRSQSLGCIAVWWQQATITAIDDSSESNEKCLCEVVQEERNIHDMQVTKKPNNSQSVQNLSPIQYQHWLILPKFNRTIELFLPIVHIASCLSGPSNNTLPCWGLNCSCNTDLNSLRCSSESKTYSRWSSISPEEGLTSAPSTSISEIGEIMPPLNSSSLSQVCCFPQTGKATNARNNSRASTYCHQCPSPKSRWTGSHVKVGPPWNTSHQRCFSYPTQFQGQGGPGVLQNDCNTTKPNGKLKHPALLIPKQVQTRSIQDNLEGHNDHIEEKTSESFGDVVTVNLTGVVQFDLPSAKDLTIMSSSSENRESEPIRTERSAEENSGHLQNECDITGETVELSSDIIDIGYRHADMVIPQSYLAPDFELIRRSSAPEIQNRSTKLPTEIDADLMQIEPFQSPFSNNILLSFENGYGVHRSGPKKFESKTEIQLSIRHVIKSFHFRSICGTGINFHSMGFCFLPSDLGLKVTVTQLKFNDIELSAETSPSDESNRKSMFHLHGFKAVSESCGIPHSDLSCRPGQSLSILGEVRPTKSTENLSSETLFSSPIKSSGGSVFLFLECLHSQKTYFNNDATYLSTNLSVIRQFLSTQQSLLQQFVISIGLPFLPDFQTSLYPGNALTNFFILHFNISPPFQLPSSQLQVQIINTSSTAVLGIPSKLIIRYINNESSPVKVRHFIQLENNSSKLRMESPAWQWLMIGSKSSITEVPSLETREIAIGLVPIQCGWLHLPSVIFTRSKVPISTSLTTGPATFPFSTVFEETSKIIPMVNDITPEVVSSECISRIGSHGITVAPPTASQHLSVWPVNNESGMELKEQFRR